MTERLRWRRRTEELRRLEEGLRRIASVGFSTARALRGFALARQRRQRAPDVAPRPITWAPLPSEMKETAGGR